MTDDKPTRERSTPPLMLDTKCSCGAHLCIEAWKVETYADWSSFFGLVKGWVEAHRPCNGKSKTT